MYKILSSP